MNDRHGDAHRIGAAVLDQESARMAPEPLRRSGLEAVGAVPWGTHFCLLYPTCADLTETLVSYFREGLAANELCMWIVSPPLAVEDARSLLAAAVPDLDEHLARGRMEILNYDQWYVRDGVFDADMVLRAWSEKLADARRRGFEGLRVSGDAFWSGDDGWRDLKRYEDTVHGVIGGARVVALCAYSLQRCGLREILDTLSNHEFALVKRGGQWELIRSIEHRAELALRQNRERLERFAEITFEGVVISENGVVVDCNAQFAALAGYPATALKGMAIRDLVVPEDRERVLENILLGRDSDVEHGLLRKDGARLCVEARGRNSPDGGQRYTAVRDVTARKAMEAAGEEARKSNERERSILQSVMNGAKNAHLVFLDREFNFVRVNEAYARTCGYTPGDMVGRNHFALYPHAENEAIFARVRDTGVPVEYHDRPFVFPDQPERGVTYWDWTLMPVRGEDGRVEGLIFSLLETTERKRAEDSLKESEERFRAMVQAVPSLTFESDAAGLVTFVSESWCGYTGMSFEQSSGRGWTEAIHPEDRDAVAARWDAAARDGALFESKHRLRARDGSHRWFIARAMPARDVHGQVVRWAGSLTDIDDLVRAEQALHEADRRKDDFLAMLAHELRNPLAPIRNAAHVLGRLGLAEPRLRWAQEIIESRVTHLTRMVDDLLDVSRIARGKIVLKREMVEVSTLVMQAIESARPLAEAKRHRLNVGLPERALWLEGDPVRLCQVLFNLLDNAIKYTPDGGRIDLDVRAVGDEVEIGVRDNGMGIPAALLPRVFDLFQQDERSLDRAQGGLGIGLTLVQRLVAKHGGRLEARSEGPGQGAAFTLWFPLRVAGQQACSSGAVVALERSKGVRVLVVDDDHAVADSTAVLLEMEGHDVRVAASGAEALAEVPAFRPHAVLVDIGLEGMDGFETARRLRQMPEGRDLCLMAVTGYGDEETRIAALEAGCDHHLVKPTHAEHLIGLLAEVARRNAV